MEFRVRRSTAKFQFSATHLSLRWKPVNTCYTSTDSSKRTFQLLCEHYFLSLFCRKHRSQNSSTVFAELDGESVTGVDCDGMVFDPNNFKAKREVIYVKWSFGEIFLSINGRFIFCSQHHCWFILSNNVFVCSLNDTLCAKKVSVAWVIWLCACLLHVAKPHGWCWRVSLICFKLSYDWRPIETHTEVLVLVLTEEQGETRVPGKISRVGINSTYNQISCSYGWGPCMVSLCLYE